MERVAFLEVEFAFWDVADTGNVAPGSAFFATAGVVEKKPVSNPKSNSAIVGFLMDLSFAEECRSSMTQIQPVNDPV